jgi:uncharacterized C2H2 Zn-finger protein
MAKYLQIHNIDPRSCPKIAAVTDVAKSQKLISQKSQKLMSQNRPQESIAQCPKCFTVFHLECSATLTNCPKCDRIEARNLNWHVSEAKWARLHGGGSPTQLSAPVDWS